MTSDELFMQRALELARLGTGTVSPNPRVGCVIVANNVIIGEGWHQKYGEAHAEVNAIRSVKDSSVLSESVVYVNLEPCSHTGKTPPCADLLVSHKVKKVVIANKDPNPLVAGQGIKKLEEAGVEVVTDVLASDGAELNKGFFSSMNYHRPFVILKWAQTSDGFLARSDFDSKWISNAYSRQLVHKWRAEEDAVLVGARTAMYDNPKLTVRDWTGRNPTRIVIDPHLKLAQQLAVFDNQAPTLCYNLQKSEQKGLTEFIKLEHLTPDELLEDLYQRKIQSVIVEGGAKTLSWFIDAGLWDEIRVFTSGQKFCSGIQAPTFQGKLLSIEQLMGDELRVVRNASFKI